MERRAFLRLLGLGGAVASAAAVFDLDRLLWVPGAKTIFLAPAAGWGNQFVTPHWVIRDIAKHLTHQLRFVSQFDRKFDGTMIGVGQSVGIQLGHRYQIDMGR